MCLAMVVVCPCLTLVWCLCVVSFAHDNVSSSSPSSSLLCLGSAVLNHVVHYARSAGWITLFIPSAFDVMMRGYVLTKSPSTRPGFVDQVRHTGAHSALV